VAGDRVQFTAVVRNQSAAAIPVGTVIGVGFWLNGKYLTWGINTSGLAAGATRSIAGANPATWTATAGAQSILAHVDDVNRFPESNESNNTRTEAFTVGPAAASTAGGSTRF
jgi:subtilase family serine protease